MGEQPDREALERRIAELERTVQRLVMLTGLPREGPVAKLPPRPAPTPAGIPPRVISNADLAPLGRPPTAPPPDFDLEQWVGAKGLLLVGVIALLAASGFFLKYAFDRGWVAPWLRVGGALLAGLAVALLGEHQVRQRLRRFGLALIGAGGGLLYLGLWAAAGPYAMVSRQSGIGAIAVVAGLFAWRSTHHSAEALALWALLGAWTAPFVLPTLDARPEAFLAYMGISSAAAMALAHAFSWRFAFAAGLVGYFLLAPAMVFPAMRLPFGFAYLALGGVAALRIAADREWPEARFGAVALPWIMMLALAGQAETEPARWAAVGGATLLLLFAWGFDRADDRFRAPELKIEMDDRGLTFLMVPVSFVLIAATAHPGVLATSPELATLAVALLYLAAGWPGRLAPFVAAGLGLIAIAMIQRWDGPLLVGGWSALIALAVLADRRLEQRAGMPIAMMTALAAGLVLTVGLLDRVASGAFTDAWALAWYAFVIATAVGAMLWRRRETTPRWQAESPRVLWALAGVMLLYAGSLELYRFFRAQRDAGWTGAELAGDLSVSVYWLLYAAALVAAGFQLHRPVVRSAGLIVAMMAVMKIALYDLSQLEALYRVASFFGLALIALGVAWAYNRASQRIAEPGPVITGSEDT